MKAARRRRSLKVPPAAREPALPAAAQRRRRRGLGRPIRDARNARGGVRRCGRSDPGTARRLRADPLARGTWGVRIRQIREACSAIKEAAHHGSSGRMTIDRILVKARRAGDDWAGLYAWWDQTRDLPPLARQHRLRVRRAARRASRAPTTSVPVSFSSAPRVDSSRSLRASRMSELQANSTGRSSATTRCHSCRCARARAGHRSHARSSNESLSALSYPM